VPIASLRFRAQFPEAVVSVSVPRSSAIYPILAQEDWDPQPLSVAGDVAGLPPIEPFATDEKTGLWQLAINTIPADSTVRVELVTTVGPGATVYEKAALDAESARSGDELLWLLRGSYQWARGPETFTTRIVVPLAFDRQSRAITTLPTLIDHLTDGS
jgi:hypothetical protein